MKKISRFVFALLFSLSLFGSARAQGVPAGGALIMYDSTGDYGWLGGLYATMLGNLLGHFPLLPYEIKPVESYVAGDVNQARTTFYFGSVYDNPLPAAFTNDLATTTNTVCWFKYNLWQIDNPAFEAKTGFAFNWLDWTGYSNVVYKGVSFGKNQLDPELGYVSVLDTNLASTPAIATKADGTSIPYITHGGNFWYVSDVPFDYIGEEDRYIPFCDVLHDILGLGVTTSTHSAVIRIEDVAPTWYDPATLRAVADLLSSNNVPFAIALVPYYTDPLGVYNNGVPETHRLSDATDTNSVAFVAAVRYMVSKGGQLIIHGYTHQYDNVDNPYTGVSCDDFEFWRETLAETDTTNGDVVTTNFTTDLYSPVAEDSAAWTLGRLNAAKQELANVGLSPVAFEAPHYAASATDYQIMATNFPLTMHRVLYFDAAGHIAGQFFPYNIYADTYGQAIIPENIGNIEPVEWYGYPPHSAADMVREAGENLVVRDGWAAGYFHPFYDLTNLTAIVQGIKALGYTYVPVSTATPPSITVEPASRTNAAGTSASFSVAAVGDGTLTYQWRFKGTNLAGGTGTLTIAGAQPANAGNYDVVVANAFGAVTSAVATLTVTVTAPVITTQPASRTNAVGTTATFTVTATGAATLKYQWRKNGVNLAGATAATLSLANVQTASTGTYSVVVSNTYGSVTSANATLTVGTAPAITTQPKTQTVTAGATATFSVAASGTATLTYQWRFNGVNLGGATAATLSLANVQPANAGTYSVVVSNAYGAATSANATLSVTVVPVITAQPQGLTSVAGTAATFSVTATGTAPLKYQWRKNGANISKATGATYTISKVTTANAGTYTVVVSNAGGSVTSSNAILTVVTAPAITTQPASRTVTHGSPTTFSVTATGTATLTYQWRFNGVNSTGATSASYTIANVQTTNAGKYTVVVSNSYGSATSAATTLTVR